MQQSLTVIAFSGVTGIGASSAAGAVSGAPTVGLVTQANGSLVYAVGNDWDRAVAHVVPAGQTKVRERINTTVGDTFWVQASPARCRPRECRVTLNATSPTSDQLKFAAVELRACAAVSPLRTPTPVTVPNVVGLTDTTARNAVTTAGLTVGTVSSENSATMALGQVIRADAQRPAAAPRWTAPSSSSSRSGPAATSARRL